MKILLSVILPSIIVSTACFYIFMSYVLSGEYIQTRYEERLKAVEVFVDGFSPVNNVVATEDTPANNVVATEDTPANNVVATEDTPGQYEWVHTGNAEDIDQFTWNNDWEVVYASKDKKQTEEDALKKTNEDAVYGNVALWGDIKNVPYITYDGYTFHRKPEGFTCKYYLLAVPYKYLYKHKDFKNRGGIFYHESLLNEEPKKRR